MLAAVFEGVGRPLVIRTVPDPEPGLREVILKVHRCGICGTDIHMTNGHGVGFSAPCVLGHELAGEVVALGSQCTQLRIGDRVAAMPLIGCTRCRFCKSHRPNLCKTFKFIGGGTVPGAYAEYARAQEMCCLPLAETLSYEDGALCEPLAVALRGVEAAQLSKRSTVLILGAGPIGLAATFWAARSGVRRLIVSAPSNRRESLARAFGADEFVILDDNAGQKIEACAGSLPSTVLECSGQPGMIGKAIGLAAHRGKIMVLGYCTTMDPIFPPAAMAKEITLRFSQLYELRHFNETAKVLLRDDRPRAMITQRVSLEQLPAAFEALRVRTHQCKIMVSPIQTTALNPTW